MRFCAPILRFFSVDSTPVGRPGRAALTVAAAITIALGASACTTTGSQPTAVSATRGPTVAFESIDGPPESVFNRLVEQLSDEATSRQVAVVSRTEAAQYRVKSYVATSTKGRQSTVSWVWDVYDQDQRRALRISGEEPASFAGTGTWAVADDQVLRRMARSGMDRLVAFMAAPAAEPRSVAPAPSPAPAAKPREQIAAADDPSAGPSRADSLAYLDAGR